MTKYIPPLMASLLAHFDADELVEFIQFIGLLVHKLEASTRFGFIVIEIYH